MDLKKSIHLILSKSYLLYSLSVIKLRALPDVRDGLKPSQRRILYSMFLLDLLNNHFRKCAKICGDTSGNYHPHGLQVVYPTLVGMAQPWVMRYPLVLSQGNFGSIDGDSPAAMRYTEAKLYKLNEQVFSDSHLKITNYVNNYDSTRKLPEVLPTRLPLLLMNGCFGLAVGLSTNIPSHNLTELCNGIIKYILNPKVNLTKYIKGPDFPTGGYIYGEEGIQDYLNTGKGKFIIRGKIEYELYKDKSLLIITLLPYSINKTLVILSIVKAVKDLKVNNVVDIYDLSCLNDIRLVLKLKKKSDLHLIIEQLYKNTNLLTSYTANMLILVDNIPKLLSLKLIVEHYINYRREIITKRLKLLLYNSINRLNIISAYKKILEDIQKFIKIVYEVLNYLEELIKVYKFNSAQLKAVTDMKITKLRKIEKLKVDLLIKQLITKINQILKDVNNIDSIDSIIKDLLMYIKLKYGDKRRSLIMSKE